MVLEIVVGVVGVRVAWAVRQAVVRHEAKVQLEEENKMVVRAWRERSDTGRHERLVISREFTPPVFAPPTVRYTREYRARTPWWRRTFLGESD